MALAGTGKDDDFDRYRELLDVKSAQAGQPAALEAIRLEFLARQPLMNGGGGGKDRPLGCQCRGHIALEIFGAWVRSI